MRVERLRAIIVAIIRDEGYSVNTQHEKLSPKRHA